MTRVHDQYGYAGAHPGMFGHFGEVLGILLLLGLLGLLIWLLLRNLGRSPQTPTASPVVQTVQPIGSPDRALEIARERYAKGEIDLAEFEAIKKNL